MGNYIETYNNLCAKAKAWSAAYYEQDAPVVTDEEYDKVMHEIRKSKMSTHETHNIR